MKTLTDMVSRKDGIMAQVHPSEKQGKGGFVGLIVRYWGGFTESTDPVYEMEVIDENGKCINEVMLYRSEFTLLNAAG